MQIIIHRVNSINKLKEIPKEFGVEIDVRGFGSRLILNHEPLTDGDNLEDYLKNFNHAFIIFNIKEAGIEQKVLDLAAKYNITNFFLLDVEPYYIHHATKAGIRNIALRFSENEPIESALVYKGKADWLWIDIPTRLPITAENAALLKHFKTCLVCPERWGRPEEITKYIKTLQTLGVSLDAVMTSLPHVPKWQKASASVIQQSI